MRDVPSGESPLMQFQVNLRQLRHEIVELVKHQPGSILLLHDFFLAYQAHFGKPCRVSDYGFSRLEDIMDAFKDLVHIVGEAPLRTIMLTHVIQVRRFTYDLLKLLKSEQKKSIPISKFPQAYETTFHKVFKPSNYGVCSLRDLLTDVPENKVTVKNNDDEGLSIVIPRRIQTVQQKALTQIFAIEVIQVLSPMRRFQIAFTKFIPAYHHTFSRQCRVSEYGFSKLAELLEALPHVVEISNEDGERYIRLVNRLRMARIKEILFEILGRQSFRRMLLTDVVSVFQTDYRLNLVPQDYKFTSLEGLFSSFPGVCLLHQQGLRLAQISQDSRTVSFVQQLAFSMTGDGPKDQQPPKWDVKTEDTPGTMTYVCLEDRHNVRDCNIQTYCKPNVGEDLTGKDLSTTQTIHLCPLMSFAKQLRHLLLRTKGRLMLSLLGSEYNRQYGVELRPETYGYPSLLALVKAINFMVAVRGKGAKSTLLLSQNYLGKLAWIIAFKLPFRHDLLLDTAELSVEPIDFSQPKVTTSEAMASSCDFYSMKTRPMQKTSINPWCYPPLLTPGRYHLAPATVASTMPPLNSIAGDPQHPPHDDFRVLPDFFAPDLEAQSYTYTETTSTSRDPDLVTPCLNPEIPSPLRGPFLRYPEASLIGDSCKFTANHLQLHFSSGEMSSHILSLAASQVWSQSSDQHLLSTPIHQFQLESFGMLQPPLGKSLLNYGYMEPYCLSHMTPGMLPKEAKSTAANSGVNMLSSEQQFSPSTESEVSLAKTKTIGSDLSGLKLSEELTPFSNVQVQQITTNPTTAFINYHPTELTDILSQATQHDCGATLIYQNTRAIMAGSSMDSVNGLSIVRNESWRADLRQWVDACRLPAPWPIFQSTPLDPLAQMQPAPVLVSQSAHNGATMPYEETHLINTVTFSQTPTRHSTKEDLGVGNNSPEDKCDEGEWTLPISVTTESTDATSGENDETDSVG
ncbi:unnamed protein product [Mesocestoides corti]|uniref:HTH OST-type domain-containing protein n=1 Tax=Mesocestoides corti TaxID=53468 RepID=A0A158QUC7_MESCO|nr:unnamed protein product [Mesocestoides corti]